MYIYICIYIYIYIYICVRVSADMCPYLCYTHKFNKFCRNVTVINTVTPEVN